MSILNNIERDQLPLLFWENLLASGTGKFSWMHNEPQDCPQVSAAKQIHYNLN